MGLSVGSSLFQEEYSSSILSLVGLFHIFPFSLVGSSSTVWLLSFSVDRDLISVFILGYGLVWLDFLVCFSLSSTPDLSSSLVSVLVLLAEIGCLFPDVFVIGPLISSSTVSSECGSRLTCRSVQSGLLCISLDRVPPVKLVISALISFQANRLRYLTIALMHTFGISVIFVSSPFSKGTSCFYNWGQAAISAWDW